MNRSAAARLVICKWMREQITMWEATAKAELGMLAGDRQTAALGGAVIGSVTMAHGATSVAVHDEQKLLEWVIEHAPSEVETVQRIRPAYRSKLMDRIKQHGALLDADGVVYDHVAEVVRGDPHSVTKTDKEAGIAISALMGERLLEQLYPMKGIEGEQE